MATKRYGVAELVEVFTQLAKPIADAWRDEGGKSWWGRVKARAAGWLRRVADMIAPEPATLTVTLAVQLPSPAPELTPEPVSVAKPITKPRKPATAKPKPVAKPVASAARVTKPKPKAKPTRKPATTRKSTARKQPAK